MKATLTTLLVSAAVLGACGGSPDAKDPSKTDTTSAPDTKAADPTTKPADPTTKPADATPTDTKATDTKATDAKPMDAKATDAKPTDASADGKCKDAPKPTAKDSKGCMAECSKLEAKAPTGSKCMPPRTACEQQCKTLGK